MRDVLAKALKNSQSPLKDNEIKHLQVISNNFTIKTWCIELETGQKIFAKTCNSENFNRLYFEATGLAELNKFASKEFLEIPVPLILDKFEGSSVLLIPWLHLVTRNQELLGKGLALLHKSSSEKSLNKFGWDQDGFIGMGTQKRGWRNSWGECFIQLRLAPQLKIAAKWGINLSEINELLSYLTLFLDNHNPKPSLVHGDLWSGNVAQNHNGKGLLFDPAVYWADREVDIAMSKLFGGFTKDFYNAYNSIWKLDDSSNTRVKIYNLYHLINHANIFGGSYITQSIQMIAKLKEEVINN